MLEKKYLNIAMLLFLLSFTFISCEKDKEDPRVETTEMTLQDDLSYMAKATVYNKGDYPILDYGFECSYGSYNTFKKSLGKHLSGDSFSCKLEINDYYSEFFYARAYITNEKGTVYGKQLRSIIPKPSISNIIPSHAEAGDTIKITGSNFSTSSTVAFNSYSARILSITKSEITVIVPTDLYSDYYNSNVSITISYNGQSTTLSSVFALDPTVTSFSPQNGTWSTGITIYGRNLYGSSIYFDNIYITDSYNSSNLNVYIPNSFAKKQFKIYVVKQGMKKEVPGGYFTMNNLSANFASLSCYLPGTTLSIQTTNANPSYNTNFLLLGSTKILNSNYSGSNIQFILPQQMAEGEYSCKLSNCIDTILLAPKVKIVKPKITDISSTTGFPGTNLTIQGSYFVNSGVTPYIYFDPLSAYGTITSYDSTNINVKVPWIAPGAYSIRASFGSLIVNSSQQFTVLEPTISSITPSSGAAGISAIISGQGFGTSSYITVFFGNLSASAISQTDTQINVKVPTGITSGTWLVKVRINGYDLSNTTTFVVP
ncbi:MAG TPA: hypothetical protein DIW31_02925 [Bacteroidales bacterium]|nr:hypothetical protein [Bacteroidales bacterium]